MDSGRRMNVSADGSISGVMAARRSSGPIDVFRKLLSARSMFVGGPIRVSTGRRETVLPGLRNRPLCDAAGSVTWNVSRNSTNRRLRGSPAIWFDSRTLRGSTRSAAGVPARMTMCSKVEMVWATPSSWMRKSSARRSLTERPFARANTSRRTKFTPARNVGRCWSGLSWGGAPPPEAIRLAPSAAAKAAAIGRRQVRGPLIGQEEALAAPCYCENQPDMQVAQRVAPADHGYARRARRAAPDRR